MTTLNHPWDVILKSADEKIAMGWTVYQKFTCSGCGARLTIDTPNTFHPEGTCDKCPALTNIKRDGCNFMAVSNGPVDLSKI